MTHGWDSSRRREQLPPDWQDRRLKVFRRDGYRCKFVNDDGIRCTGPAEECDHIVPGNDHSMSNLQSLCHGHHAHKTAKEAAIAKAKNRKRIRKKFRRNETHPGLI